LEQGPTEATIIEQSVKAGWPLPESIANAPSLSPGLELYYIAFLDLMSCRQMGMSSGPIWWTTVQEYCNLLKLSEEQTEAMHFHIKEMDLVYLKHSTKK